MTTITLAAGLLGVAAPAGAGHVREELAAAPAKTKPPAVPRAAYVITPGIGFRVGVKGRAIGRFVLPVKCGKRIFRISHIPIKPDGRFRFSGRSRGWKPTRIHVVGRFYNRSTARGWIQLAGPKCPKRRHGFVARLS